MKSRGVYEVRSWHIAASSGLRLIADVIDYSKYED